MKLKGFIERQKVYETLNGLGGCGAKPESFEDGWDKAIGTAIFDIVEIPAADVAPVVHHGKWIKIQNYAKCSECTHEVNWGSEDFLSSYCPNCGAKMDKKDG